MSKIGPNILRGVHIDKTKIKQENAMQISDLRYDKGLKIAEMKRMLDTAEDQGRAMSVQEEQRYQLLDSEIDNIDKEIRQMEHDNSRRNTINSAIDEGRKIINPLPERARGGHYRAGGDYSMDDDRDFGFRNLAEMLFSVARFKKDGVRDERLDRSYEKREQTMGTGATGGFSVGTQFDSTLRMVTPAEAVMRPRATVIPAGNLYPDAKLEFPTLDQTSAQNMHGGVVVTHTGEGVTMTETTARLREVTLEPKEMSAYITITEKLLRNWDSSGDFVTMILRQAMLGQEDADFLRGDGVNKALGCTVSGAALAHTRAGGLGTSTITFVDCVNMLSKVLMRGPLIWVASQTVIPQLASMVDIGNHAIWLGGNGNQGAGAQGVPSTLLGIPLIFNDRMPGLGSKGDLCLLAPSLYMIKDGSGPIAASSEHVFFTSNKVVFKLVWNVDGRPWLTEPLGLEGSTANTVSPFVVLQ